MVIGCYVYSPVEQCAGYSCCFVKPDFTPRKVEPRTADASGGMGAPGVKDLSDMQKNALKDKLNNGRGNLSLQEWDDFLADLEEFGIISHDERFTANGTLHDIPEDALHGGTHFSSGNTRRDLEQMWTGDPLKWLDDMDVYMLKNQLYASMGSHRLAQPDSQREIFRRTAGIVRDIMG